MWSQFLRQLFLEEFIHYTFVRSRDYYDWKNMNSSDFGERNDTIDLEQDPDIVYIPECENELKPYIGRKFRTLEEGEECYKQYGGKCGFDTRLGTISRSKDKTIMWRYVLCNREGEKNVTQCSSDSKRRRMSSRALCMTRVVFRYLPGEGYVVTQFNKGHSHPLVSNNYKQFMKYNRRLDYSHQSFILNCARANIGPMKSFRLFKELVGSHQSVGCSTVDFRNFSQDLRAFFCGADAQILLDKTKNMRETCPGFTFDYCVDDSNRLKRLFWADPISIKYYQIFGEAVSFDATYSTNEYNMIFAPFTGKDNHGKCVTFAVGLLSNEDIESYSWLFSKFYDCMGKSLKMIITDQDPAMKIAIEQVMRETRHRFCMWHIILKVADKIPNSLRDNEEFTSNFNGIVWSNYIKPFEFEEQWKTVMEEFNLNGHKWFDAMFDLRYFLIPAYFRDFPMSGLFRTTSMSESENNFFRKYFNSKSNLIGLLSHFQSALDSQRHDHNQLNSLDESSFPKLLKQLPLERHVAAVYTNSVFLEVRKQIIVAIDLCCIVNITSEKDVIVYEEDDDMNGVFSVIHNVLDYFFSCECNHFIMTGLPCRHMFLVFKNMKIQSIPEKYILSRWRKFNTTLNEQIYTSKESENMPTFLTCNDQIFSEFRRCVGFAGSNFEDLSDLLNDLRELSHKYQSRASKSLVGNSKKKLLEQFYGSTIPECISILPPEHVKTKGSGSRLKSRKEKALRDLNKPKRRCSKCKQMTNHDARNCDKFVS